jgi:hypothetical protein
MNERSNDRTNGRTNHERSEERSNKLRTGGVGVLGGGESCHEMAWGGLRGGPCPSIYRLSGELGGGGED